MPIALLAATLFGLYSKESALCLVPLVPVAALLTAQITHPEHPRRWARALVAALVTASGFVFYVEMRRRWFPVATPHDLTAEANAGGTPLHRAFVAALRWYAQPMLPHDPLNNPLIEATPPYRIAGALRVFTRGLGQVIFPRVLAGDYLRAPQEPMPRSPRFSRKPLRRAGDGRAARRGARRGHRVVVALAARAPDVWLVAHRTGRPALAQRAGRRLRAGVDHRLLLSRLEPSRCSCPPCAPRRGSGTSPAVGTAMILGILFTKLFATSRRVWSCCGGVRSSFALYLGFQCYAARLHALDYNSDL